MKVKIKKLHPNAVIPFKKHESDFCYDIVATSVQKIFPNVYKYGTGLSFEIDGEEEYVKNGHQISIDIRPRSSICKTGLVLANSTGTIDYDYRGEITAVFYHVVPSLPIYKVGDRIAQMKVGFTEKIDFLESEELSETERGKGGYGSTGK